MISLIRVCETLLLMHAAGKYLAANSSLPFYNITAPIDPYFAITSFVNILGHEESSYIFSASSRHLSHRDSSITR